jgi:hypothetical protein
MPLDLGEYLPFGDLLAGQAAVAARPAAEVDGHKEDTGKTLGKCAMPQTGGISCGDRSLYHLEDVADGSGACRKSGGASRRERFELRTSHPPPSGPERRRWLLAPRDREGAGVPPTTASAAVPPGGRCRVCFRQVVEAGVPDSFPPAGPAPSRPEVSPWPASMKYTTGCSASGEPPPTGGRVRSGRAPQASRSIRPAASACSGSPLIRLAPMTLTGCGGSPAPSAITGGLRKAHAPGDRPCHGLSGSAARERGRRRGGGRAGKGQLTQPGRDARAVAGLREPVREHLRRVL